MTANAENKQELVSKIESQFRGHLKGEFPQEKRSDVLVIDFEGHRFLYDLGTPKKLAIEHAKSLLEQYK